MRFVKAPEQILQLLPKDGDKPVGIVVDGEPAAVLVRYDDYLDLVDTIEAVLRLNDPDDTSIPLETALYELGL